MNYEWEDERDMIALIKTILMQNVLHKKYGIIRKTCFKKK